MSMAALERKIHEAAKKEFGRDDLKLKDMMEWSSGEIKAQEGESVKFVPAVGLFVCYRLPPEKVKKMIADNPNYPPPKRQYISSCVLMDSNEFNEWVTERFNEYNRAGIMDENAPNHSPSDVVEQFVTDFIEKFHGGVRVTV
jgi:hypothetical protein